MAHMRLLILAGLLTLILYSSGCMPASQHHKTLHSAAEREMTVGLVQARILKGMSGAEVAEVLGSPNIVTRDAEGGDTWIYDKIATEASYSNDTGSTAGFGGAGGQPGASSLILGGLLSGYSRNAGAAASTQKTLTVIVKFDQRQRVKDFSYHASKF